VTFQNNNRFQRTSLARRRLTGRAMPLRLAARPLAMLVLA
jgi:hypothetical protein